MPGFVVGAQVEVDGEWWLDVETTTDALGCPSCGTRAAGHGRRKVKIRDLPMAGRPVVLVWAKHIWCCKDADCPTTTWSETSPAIGARAALSERARAEICRSVGEDGDSVAQVARDFGVGWYTAMAAVIDHGTPLVDDPTRLEGTRALGLDETKYLCATRTHHTQYVTSFVDLQEAFLLDVVAGRSAKVVDDWLGGRPEEWLQAISVVAIDPFRGYANGLLAHLGHAGVVVDHFHAVRLANQAIDDVRRRVQNQTTGHRGRRGDPLYGIRRLALVGAERLSERGWGRLLAGLAAGDPEGEMGAAILAKELLREVYWRRWSRPGPPAPGGVLSPLRPGRGPRAHPAGQDHQGLEGRGARNRQLRLVGLARRHCFVPSRPERRGEERTAPTTVALVRLLCSCRLS